jgi:hypothetical protein
VCEECIAILPCVAQLAASSGCSTSFTERIRTLCPKCAETVASIKECISGGVNPDSPGANAAAFASSAFVATISSLGLEGVDVAATACRSVGCSKCKTSV